MINRPSKSANPTHYFGAVLKCALLLIFFTFGVEVYAQSYNMSESYRIGGSTQSTPSATQWNGGVYNAVGSRVSGSTYRVSGNTPRVSDNAYRAFDDGYQVPNVTYKAYQGTVYEPFNDTPPSESASDGGPKGISDRRNSFDDFGTPSNPGESAPLGDSWVLLLFAAMATIAITLRKKQTA